ncbi:DUF6221 family protein [Nonomuraea sp. NPDC047897]|uniref:DUF6221 family protein n=1 Tax=Nonomuraea sp. NPDC047897 TaxID=3364346 RepID=UPI0037241DF3
MRLTAIVDYLSDRWDEEDDTLDRIMSMKYVQGYIRVNGERMRAELTAKRKILIECQSAIQRDSEDAGLARTVLNLLAEPYADRGDFPRRHTAHAR